MKHVLFIDLARQYGGAEKYIEGLIDEYREKKIKTSLLLRKNSLFSAKINGDEVITIDASKISIFKDIDNVKKYIYENNVNIIHVNGINSEVFLKLLKYKIKEKNIVYVSTIHGIAEFDRMERSKIERIIFSKLQVNALKSVDKIIAVSNSIKENLLEKGIKENKIEVIYHGLKKIPHFDDCYSENTPIKICYIGRMEKVKNVDFLINKLISLKDSFDFVCELYGDGKERERLENIVKNAELQDRIKFMGYKNNISDILVNYDLLVQPSFYESFGLSVLEAMSQGVPVLCSRVGGMKEIIVDGETGFLFDIESSSEFDEKIKNIATGKINLNQIRKNAYISVKQRFLFDTMVEKTLNVYEKEK